MEKMLIDEFIEYAKQQYGVDVLIEQSTEPDSFKSIFGASFLEENNNIENMDNTFEEVEYVNSCVGVSFNFIEASNENPIVYTSDETILKYEFIDGKHEG